MKWILVFVLFSNGEVAGDRVFHGDTKAECEEARKIVMEKTKGEQVWAGCFEVEVPKKPVIPPEKMNSDGPSPDGKRRGGNA